VLGNGFTGMTQKPSYSFPCEGDHNLPQPAPSTPSPQQKARQVQTGMLTVLTFTKLCIINFSSRKNSEPTQLHCHLMVSVGKCVVKTTEKWNLGECFLQHHNAPAHFALVRVNAG